MKCSEKRSSSEKKLLIIICGFQKPMKKGCKMYEEWKKGTEVRKQIQNLLRGKIKDKEDGLRL